jgi:hypothetical protein
MNYVSELTIEHLRRHNCQVPQLYADLLQTATDLHPPPHGKSWYGKAYRQAARNASWFADSLILNAYEEGNGSRQVWEFAGQVERPEFAELIRHHAIDESRHSKMFATLLELLFPTQLEAKTRTQVNAFCPGYHPGDLKYAVAATDRVNDVVMMDRLILINLLEIRALILQLLLRPVLLAYAQPQDCAQVRRMCDRFISDETQHIAYSAYCISNYATWGDRNWLCDRFIDRQSTVNLMFLQESDSGTETVTSEMFSSRLSTKITT